AGGASRDSGASRAGRASGVGPARGRAMRILTAEEMRGVDRAAIERLGLPGLVLMENAALGVVDAIGRQYPQAESAAIFCGPGNNGGDGLAVARQLATRGYAVEIFLAVGTAGKAGGAGDAGKAGDRPLAGDAGLQLAVCRRLELTIHELAPDGDAAAAEAGLAAALAAAGQHDLVIDALFGTGLARPLTGWFARLVEGLNEVPRPRVAVDIPSGLSGSSAEPPGPHLLADLTVTFAAPKVAHVFPPAADAVGELVVTDLGFPRRLVDEAAGDLHLLVGEELSGLLPPRARDSHKGDYGHLLLVAGSPGKAGAAVLAARAAVRAGAGLVTAAVPEQILQIVHLGSIESMVLPLPTGSAGPPREHGAGDAGGGHGGGDALTAAAVEQVLAAAAGKSALAVGPGLGQEAGTVAAIRRLAAAAELPLVLDADGINAFAGRPEELAARRAPTVLTPHPGELGRLLGISTAEVQADRPAAARRAAAATGAIVVLKGSLTLIAAPRGGLYVNPTGNPGMASGGTGDVLTGILGGLLAQRLEPLDAACLAVYLHGLAGDLALARLRSPSLAAEDLIASLPAAFADLADGKAP
ncbi:MAG TPA: NAD(P)H-hydrate dehydratase, partial [Thermoanaerobaculia bacterium]|nr:NAD(P)H-hydrate dehydratase [Thermoanaerobaculia bacterium]